MRLPKMPTRILVVEDDLLNRMLLCTVLENAGFEVDYVTDGAHAIERTKEFRPDLITMDMNLPSVSGLVLIKDLKSDPKLQQIPVLAVTAYVGRGEEARIRKAGAAGFLAKPVSIKPFLKAVNDLLPAEEQRSA